MASERRQESWYEDMTEREVPKRLREIADALAKDRYRNQRGLRGQVFGAWKALEDAAILREAMDDPDENRYRPDDDNDPAEDWKQ